MRHCHHSLTSPQPTACAKRKPTESLEGILSEDHTFDPNVDESNNNSSPRFIPHAYVLKYPKPIQKHINKKNSNLGKAIEGLKTPSKQFAAKEARRLSELSKNQNDAYLEMVWQSSSKKKKLFEEEWQIKSELIRKGVEIDNPVLDVKKVFVLPEKHKRKKNDRENIRASDPISEFSRTSICNPAVTSDSQEVSIFESLESCEGSKESQIEEEMISREIKRSQAIPFGEIDTNLPEYNCTENRCEIQMSGTTRYVEPETLFKEVQNLQQNYLNGIAAASEVSVKGRRLKEEFSCEEYNDNYSFECGCDKSEANGFLLKEYDKENGPIIEDANDDGFMEAGETQAPYIAPSFARVFSE